MRICNCLWCNCHLELNVVSENWFKRLDNLSKLSSKVIWLGQIPKTWLNVDPWEKKENGKSLLHLTHLPNVYEFLLLPLKLKGLQSFHSSKSSPTSFALNKDNEFYSCLKRRKHSLFGGHTTNFNFNVHNIFRLALLAFYRTGQQKHIGQCGLFLDRML